MPEIVRDPLTRKRVAQPENQLLPSRQRENRVIKRRVITGRGG